MNLTEGLNTRFNIVTQSTSDKEFYLNLHQYCDFIHNSDVLATIIRNSQFEYSKEMGEIWGENREYTQEELSEKSSQVSKLERFNLYSLSASIFVRVYNPIEDYKTTPELDNKQDPAVVILMRGFDYALKLNRWMKEDLDIYKKWFEGRNVYEPELRRFHLELLNELTKPLPIKIKPEIIFDEDKSILKIDNKIINITLKNDKPNAHYVLEYLFENEEGLNIKSYYTEIINSKFPKEKMDWRSVHRASIDINKKVSEQANINNFLIIKTGISGYIQVNSEYL